MRAEENGGGKEEDKFGAVGGGKGTLVELAPLPDERRLPPAAASLSLPADRAYACACPAVAAAPPAAAGGFLGPGDATSLSEVAVLGDTSTRSTSHTNLSAGLKRFFYIHESVNKKRREREGTGGHESTELELELERAGLALTISASSAGRVEKTGCEPRLASPSKR